MKHKTTLLLALITLMVTASCKSDEDQYTVTLYGDAAITNFTIGTVHRTVGSTESTYDASGYTFSINSLTHEIENTDSLLTGTDITRVQCTVTTLNNGVPSIKDLKDGEYYYHNAADSVDFTTDRTFRIWASDGSGYTDYTVKLNVHKENGDDFVWTSETSVPWTDDVLPAGISRLLGESNYEKYALSTAGKIMAKSTANDATWNQDIADDHEDAAMLPTTDVALVSYPMTMADSTDYVLLAGTVGSKQTVVWRKIVDNHGKKAQGTWSYMERDEGSLYQLPMLSGLSLFRYDGVTFAFGGDYQHFYESRDNGITWKPSTRIALPADFDYSATSVEVRVVGSDLWLKCTGGSSQIWRGRLKRLAWEVKN